MPIWIPRWTSETSRRKKRQENNNNEMVWTHKPAWYVLIACIVRYVLLMSQAKFMLCTRLRNDTPVSMYTIHTISHKCSLFQTASAAPKTHTVKSNRSWHNGADMKASNNNSHDNEQTDARIFSHTRPSSSHSLTHAIIIRIGSIGVYEWVTFTVRQHCDDYVDTNNDDEWIAEKRFVYFSPNLSILVAAFSCWTLVLKWVEMRTATTLAASKIIEPTTLCAYFPLNIFIYTRLVSMSTNAFHEWIFPVSLSPSTSNNETDLQSTWLLHWVVFAWKPRASKPSKSGYTCAGSSVRYERIRDEAKKEEKHAAATLVDSWRNKVLKRFKAVAYFPPIALVYVISK